MAGIRDDSAGPYGQWTNDPNQSWGDYLKMLGMDVGEGAYNALANITGGLSPIGTSQQGNMSLQVPPMINGLMDAGKTIADRGGVGFSGVEEIDAPLKKAWADVLLTGYGGNALSGLAKPRGALGAGAMREAEAQPIRAYRGATNAGNIARDDASILWGSSSPDVASTYARPHFNTGDIQGAVAPLDVNFSNPLTVDAKNGSWVGLEHNGQRYTADDLAILARDQGHDGLIVKNVMDAKSWYPGDPKLGPADNYVALQRGTVKSPLTGETLFSDNKPSILGAALATAGEPKGITAYHGSPHDFDKFSLDKIGTGEGAQAYGHGLYFADSEGVARSYRDNVRNWSDASIKAWDSIKAHGSPDAAMRSLQNAIDVETPMLRGRKPYGSLKSNMETLEALKSGKYPTEEPGKMYQVRINADPESFLDWDKPLSQQSEAVRNALAGLSKPRGALGAGAMREASGLPMDQASRMARAKEMGFDTDNVLYHGTASQFDEFKPSEFGSLGPGVYLTPDAAHAQKFAGGLRGGESPNVMELYTKGKFANMQDIPADAINRGIFTDLFGLDGTPASRASNWARENGYDGLIQDGYQTVVFDPRNIRSVNAAFDPAKADSANLLYSDNKPSLLGAALATAGEQPKGITAYHGSPHDFDKFSLDKIGTGEGAQAYGHGLYFADSEGVARSYRDTLSKNSPVTIDGKVVNQNSPLTDKYLSYYFRDGDPSPTNALKKAQDSEKEALAHAANLRSGADDRANKNARGFLLAQAKIKDTEAASHADGVRRLQEYIEAGAIRGDNPGRMYQVRINADPESFLDWDKPLSQQSEAVRNALAPIADAKKAEFLSSKQQLLDRRIQDDADMLRLMGIESTTKRAPDDVADLLAEFDRRAAGDLAVDPSATSKLREAGIPGIRYLDGQSRGSGSGSSNYVVFDDSLIEILKKYGIAAGAVGAGALAQPDQASAQDLPDWLKF